MLKGYQDCAKAFQQQYGIAMNFELMEYSGQGLSMITTDWPNTDIDIFPCAPAVALAAQNAGYLAPLEPDLVPNMGDIPDLLHMPQKVPKPYAVACSFASVAIMYRKDLVPKPITSYHDLLDPALKKKVGWSSMGNWTGLLLIQAALANGGDEYNTQPGWDYLKKLAPSIGLVTDSSPTVIDAITRGDIWAFFENSTGDMTDASSKGVSIGAVMNPTDSKLWVDMVVMTVLNRPNQVWAEQYVNTVLSPDVNTLFGNDSLNACSNTKCTINAASSPFVLPLDQITSKGYVPNPAQQAKMIDAWTKQYETDIQPLVGTG
jgi:putative spermidine/putrescine transport system substrate-binding protein